MNQYAPRSCLRRLWRKVQRQRTSPDAGESKHADCGKNRSDRSGRRVPEIAHRSTCYERSDGYRFTRYATVSTYWLPTKK
jgi:hypothetical protein